MRDADLRPATSTKWLKYSPMIYKCPIQGLSILWYGTYLDSLFFVKKHDKYFDHTKQVKYVISEKIKYICKHEVYIILLKKYAWNKRQMNENAFM